MKVIGCLLSNEMKNYPHYLSHLTFIRGYARNRYLQDGYLRCEDAYTMHTI
jgi:hypothetical protein